MTATITRAATATPATVDEATRSVELLIATESPLNGIQLTCTRAAVTTSDAAVPVLMSHENHVDAMAGRLGPLRFESGKILARAFFSDAPAADAGWQLAKAGCAVSVGASFVNDDSEMKGSLEIVRRWRLVEVSLVPAGKDPATLTRSLSSISPMDNIIQATEPITESADDQELTRSEANRQLQIIRSAGLAKLSADETDRIIRETAGQPVAAGLMQVIQRHAEVIEGRAGAAGHPARVFTGNGEPQGIEATLTRAIRGERLEQPLWLTLRSAGVGHGNSATEVWRSALTGEGRWLARSLSTSDLPALLTESGNRRLMERFQVAESGVRVAASVRRLVDYREAGVIDVGAVGSAKVINEGGEITFGSVNESGAKYQPKRFGIGLSFTPEAMANDDLAGLDAALSELAAAMLDAESVALVDLLEGAANGRNAPDGLALFHANHANAVSAGPLAIQSIGTAVQKLREMKAIGGRYVAQEPAALLVGSAMETTARQLLSTAINAAQASNVNPWQSLEIAVEPRLSGTYAYIIGNSRKPLELGRLTDGPVLTTEIQFETSAYRAKSEHAFGAIVQEHRSIIRIPTAA
ncbi:Mu-like prophage major head subunit gpT family protein [Cyanobium sp. BA20m-14]|uniref:phage major capsid protein n=1 Tax=Cyanobium sp. BA20m-14 TaxID=2823703 RepID=UPI0020CEE733|nr:Mu-like prophage major head subunit gpT family protein [Cyanobium sp. BA20m-14]MCP9913731.1 Mu-like prophage major head subunit gpT family protein [Cyanobium sp. BA20m-14]